MRRCSRPSSSTCPVPESTPKAPLQLQVSRSTTRATSAASASAASSAARSRSRQTVAVRTATRQNAARAKVAQVLTFKGLERVTSRKPRPATSSLITGIEDVDIGVTCATRRARGLPPIAVDEPTLTMNFQVNTSPLAGREGKFVTSRQIRERLQRELKSNVALRVEDTEDSDTFASPAAANCT
jgi:GTP-binding protein